MLIALYSLLQPVNSRFIIDHNTFGAYHPDHIKCDSLKDRLGRFDRWPERVPYTANLSKEQLILLPPGIHAFYMQNKTWGRYTANNFDY